MSLVSITEGLVGEGRLSNDVNFELRSEGNAHGVHMRYEGGDKRWWGVVCPKGSV